MVRTGRPPIGSKPDERRLVERAVELAADGLSAEKIAERLTAESIRSRHGGAIHATQVRRILARIREEESWRRASEEAIECLFAIRGADVAAQAAKFDPVALAGVLARQSADARDEALRRVGAALAPLPDRHAWAILGPLSRELLETLGSKVGGDATLVLLGAFAGRAPSDP